MTKRSLISIVLLLIARTALADAQAQKPPAYAQVHAFFTNYCIACHNERDVKGGLILESFETLELGGDTGAVFEPGNAAESRIVKVLLGQAKPKMPPEDAPQPKPEEIAILQAWIDAGAKGPEPGSEPTLPPSLPSVPLTVPVVAAVSAVAWSPDGKQLAAARGDEVLVFETGKLTAESAESAEKRGEDTDFFSPQARKFRRESSSGHAGQIAALAFSPDGRLLAAVGGSPSRSGEITLWSTADGQLVRTLRGHDDVVYGVAWTPDGKQLVTCSYDQRVKVWSIETGEQIRELKEHTDAVFGVDISPDGRWLATASGDRTVKLWDLATGRRRYTLSEALDAVYCAAFRGDGRQIAAGGADKTIRIWDLSEQGPVLARSAFAHDGAVLRVSYSPDGKSLFSTGEDQLVKRWDVDTLTEEATFAPQPDWVLALAVSPDGDRLALGRYDGSLALVDSADGNLVAELLSPASKALAKGGQAAHATRETEGGHDAEAGGARAGQSAEPGGPSWKPAELSSVSPRDAVRGETVRVTLTGTNLADAFAVTFSDPKITATLVEPEKPSDEKNKLEIDVSLPADLRPGIYPVLVETPYGTTGTKPFAVHALPMVEEQETKDGADMPHEVSLPGTLVGTIDRPGDEDLWSFEASSGETLVFETVASTLGSQAAVHLSLADSGGRTLAEARPSENRPDALLAWKFDDDGRYVLKVSDLQYGGGGGGGFFYRIHAGSFAYVTGVFPSAVQRGSSAELDLTGFNVLENGDGKASIVVDASDKGGQAAHATRGRLRIDPPGEAVAFFGSREVLLTDEPVLVEQEPNDVIDSANVLSVPFGVSGRINPNEDSRAASASEQLGPPDADLYGFQAAEGERLAIEVTARRLGSALDSLVEVLDTSGKPVAIATLRPTAQTEIALRDHSSRGDGLRIISWSDLDVGDHVLVGGELLEVLALPRGPDDNIRFVNSGGQRLGLLGTTPEAHALGAPVYKVEIDPPGRTFPPNGMPVFELTARNDDGGPAYDSDSYFVFEAPADGTYYVRLSDARGLGGDDFTYHLAVRHLVPDYRLAMSPEHASVPRGGSIPVEVTAERHDEFDGPIAVHIEGLPQGVSATEGVIDAGQFSTTLTISADENAKQPLESAVGGDGGRIRAVGSAEIGGKSVVRSTSDDHRLTLAPPADVRVWVEPTEVAARPGDEVTFTVHVDRQNGFGGRVPVDVRTLRHGARVLNVGLNGVLVTEDQTSRQFTIKVEPWINEGAFQFFAVGKVENAGRNDHASPPVVLRVTK